MEDTTIEDVLKTVQNYYAQKDYQKALEHLNKHQNSIPEGVWHYNAGTVQGKLGDWVLARFHFLMAEEKGFTSKEVILNRQLAEAELNTEKLEAPTSGFDYFFRYSMVGSQGVFTSVGLMLIVVGVITLWKKASAKVTLTFFALAFLTLGFNWWILSLDRRIVLQSQPIFEGPSSIFSSTSELPSGIVVLTSQRGEWLKILYPSRYEGWIKDSGLKELR